jgi:hypothetical protein
MPAGAEAAALAGDDDRAHLVIALQSVEGVAQFGVNLERQRVQRVRARKLDAGDSVRLGIKKIGGFDRGLRHVLFPIQKVWTDSVPIFSRLS